jgi:hypothetical protein
VPLGRRTGENMKFYLCECLKAPRIFNHAVSDLWEEVIEFVEKPSFDEASDICFAFGRLIASIFHKIYIRMPGDSMCIRKIEQRFHESGCIRSLNHRPFGVCAATIEHKLSN